MSEFFDKYATAPAIRTLTPDEVKVGMVVRVTGRFGTNTFRVNLTPLNYKLADLIELLEDDPREELAKRLYAAYANGRWTWDEASSLTREGIGRMADEAMRWAEQRADQ